MRPKSIGLFDRLFLFSLAIGLLSTFLDFDKIEEKLRADPAMASLGLGSGAAIGAIAFVFGISILLWYLVAYRASNVAKWILVIFVAVGAVLLVFNLGQVWALANILSAIGKLIEIAAIAFLFRPDAKAWFAEKRGAADPE